MKPALKITLDDSRLRAFPDRLRKRGKKLVQKTTKNIAGRMKVRIQHGPKTGRIYVHNGIPHQASAPGQAPATDMGELVNSIDTSDGGELREFVNVHAEYGAYPEFGTSKMASRPYMRPSFEDERKNFEDGVSRLIGEARR